MKKLIIALLLLLCSLGGTPKLQAEIKADGDGSELKNSFISSKEGGPVLVKSNTLSLDANTREFTYKGNVELRRDGLFITSDTLKGFYNELNELTLVRCEGNVVITRDTTLRATSEKAEFDLLKDIIVLTQSPELQHKGSALTADKVTIFVQEDRSEAEGDVRVKILQPVENGLNPGRLG